ncbi:unnamed protein product [Ceutorhynchus assimilis]|uniref:Regulatory protein zeste n=1 Tax=Ceutorhynchus assimilis TaxID=467358 RepID=A0A9N9MM27_9CUCU|nr:unnamed protein product [Ceutorhynchus assimilis]
MSGRAANFCKEEELFLISLIDKYKNVIESKKSDANSWKDKEMAWKKVEAEFNASCKTNGVRPLKVLKEKYRNLKKKTKEKFSRAKMELIKTEVLFISPQ